MDNFGGFARKPDMHVNNDGDSCNELPGSSEVPQGPVFGLILFLLYINDLPDNIQSNVHLFADDTAVYLTVQGQ